MTSKSRLQDTLDFITLWSDRDIEAILARLASDCVYHNMPWPALTGHDQIREALAGFIGGAEKIDWQVLHAAETARGVVLTERVDRFLIKGQWLEIPVSGTFEWRGDLLVHWRDYFDSAQFETAMASLA